MNRDRSMGRLVALAFIAISVFFMAIGFNEIRLARASASWPSVTGQITYSKLDDPADNSRGINLGYAVEIEYIYNAEGRRFESSRVFFGDGFVSSNRSFHQKIVDKYYPGATVEVFYKPNNISESTLETGLTKNSFSKLFFGTLTLFGGIVAFVVSSN